MNYSIKVLTHYRWSFVLRSRQFGFNLTTKTSAAHSTLTGKFLTGDTTCECPIEHTAGSIFIPSHFIATHLTMVMALAEFFLCLSTTIATSLWWFDFLGWYFPPFAISLCRFILKGGKEFCWSSTKVQLSSFVNNLKTLSSRLIRRDFVKELNKTYPNPVGAELIVFWLVVEPLWKLSTSTLNNKMALIDNPPFSFNKYTLPSLSQDYRPYGRCATSPPTKLLFVQLWLEHCGTKMVEKFGNLWKYSTDCYILQ